MIHVTLKDNALWARGHSGSGPRGQDILCAAVSILMEATAAALADLGLLNGKTDGGTAHYYVSDTPDNFDVLAHTFLGEYAGGSVERIAIETY